MTVRLKAKPDGIELIGLKIEEALRVFRDEAERERELLAIRSRPIAAPPYRYDKHARHKASVTWEGKLNVYKPRKGLHVGCTIPVGLRIVVKGKIQRYAIVGEHKCKRGSLQTLTDREFASPSAAVNSFGEWAQIKGRLTPRSVFLGEYAGTKVPRNK